LELLERIEKDYKELFYPLSQEDYYINTIEPNYLFISLAKDERQERNDGHEA
jgi:hypothetical protein